MYCQIIEQVPLSTLITLDEVKRQCVLPLSSTTYDDELSIMLNASLDLSQAYTRVLLTTGSVVAEFDEVDNTNGFVLLPFAASATEITSVSVDGVTTDNYYYSDVSKKLIINDKFTLATVNYTTGLTTIPDGVRLGALMMCNTFFNNRDDFVPNMSIEEIPNNSLFALDMVKRYV